MSDQDQGEGYQKKLEARLDEIETRIKTLKAKAQQASTESKVNARGRIRKAKEEYEKVQERINEYRTTTRETQRDLQKKVEEAMDDLRDAVNDAIKQLG